MARKSCNHALYNFVLLSIFLKIFASGTFLAPHTRTKSHPLPWSLPSTHPLVPSRYPQCWPGTSHPWIIFIAKPKMSLTQAEIKVPTSPMVNRHISRGIQINLQQCLTCFQAHSVWTFNMHTISCDFDRFCHPTQRPHVWTPSQGWNSDHSQVFRSKSCPRVPTN